MSKGNIYSFTGVKGGWSARWFAKKHGLSIRKARRVLLDLARRGEVIIYKRLPDRTCKRLTVKPPNNASTQTAGTLPPKTDTDKSDNPGDESNPS